MPARWKGRAEGQNRTGDTSIFSAVLYRLSYLGSGPIVGPGLFAVKLDSVGGNGYSPTSRGSRNRRGRVDGVSESVNPGLWVAAAISGISLVVWVWLLLFRGLFWRTSQQLKAFSANPTEGPTWPGVSVLVPARNEADAIPESLPNLLLQDYPGPIRVFLVDDESDDGTAQTAERAAAELSAGDRLTVVRATPPPAGWTGKLWALQQGVRASGPDNARYLLLTDADIVHPLDSVRRLVEKAEAEELDMVSLMVLLQVRSLWSRLLIPAFVYFFAKLFPFRWVNDPENWTAAAAGGCILVRRDSLDAAGGLERISGELIDDCALAWLVSEGGREGGARIWLGLTQDVYSVRPYPGLSSVWQMVARTAYTQLRRSPVLLAGTFAGMLLAYAVPPLSMLGGVGMAVAGVEPGLAVWLTLSGVWAWAIMSASYVPMLRWYGQPLLLAPLLPAAGFLYALMTVASGWRHLRGRGGMWRGRTGVAA